MTDLVDFARHIEQHLASTNRQPHWDSGEVECYMIEVGKRRERFKQQAARLSERVVQPRLETLASYFVNASLTKNEPAGFCSCWFEYSEQFPASTKVAFAIEHDARFERVVVGYEAVMMPLFIKFNGRDKLTLALDNVTDAAVSEWVEERLLDFLDAYLRIDCGGIDEEAATDPVCGMRINRSSAAASASHVGHPYYFCSTDCRAKFSENPKAYVQVKPM